MNMKNLENGASIQELNLQEMQETGGGFWLGLAIGIVIAECLDRNAGRDFSDGWDAA